MSDPDTPELLNSREVFQSTKFTVVEESFRLPSGDVVDRAMLAHPGAAVILPQLENGKVVLMEQYRYALKRKIYEFPAGTVDLGETVESTARRELIEEIGGRASELVSLGADFTTPGFTNELIHSFFAKNVALGAAEPEQGEFINIKVLTVSEVEKLILSGEMNDMKSIIVFFRARLRGLI